VVSSEAARLGESAKPPFPDPGNIARLKNMPIFRVMFLGTLCGIFVAGLWPFCAPKNDVSWLENENGLYLGHHGGILSAGEFKTEKSTDDSTCSLEIWLQPAPFGVSSHLLTLTKPGTSMDSFLLYQWTDHLVVKSTTVGAGHEEQTGTLVVRDVFHKGQREFVTIVSGPSGTAVYLNGALAEKSGTSRIPRGAFAGRLMLAGKSGWSGELLGLAFYGGELSEAEVLRHYESWATRSTRPEIAANEKPVALYLFDERAGRTAHNEIDSSTDLLIPKRYFVLHPVFLLPPWREFRPGWGYVRDIAINIAGFVPLGFFFCACGLSIGKAKGATGAMILGFTVSLTIEVLQGWLPTRDSGTTDLLTNTLGTGLGAILWNCGLTKAVVRNRLDRLRFTMGGE